MAITLFGGAAKETGNEKDRSGSECHFKVEALQAELMQAREQLRESQAKMAALQDKLDEYMKKERQIAEVMIYAQISAQKTEAQARARAEVLIQETDEELRRKNKELELLRLKVQLFKQDIGDYVDQYKMSLEQIPDPDEDRALMPTLVEENQKLDDKLVV